MGPPVICYICGKKFGTASISIHEPQCIEKFKLEQSKLPKGQRKPLPERPELIEKIISGDTEALEAYNEVANEAYLNQRSECPNCQRKFAPDRLIVHLKSCREENAMKLNKPKNVEDSSSKLPNVKLPNVKSNVKSPSMDSSAQLPISNQLANYCPQCGTKFVPNAKFCAQCGTARVSI